MRKDLLQKESASSCSKSSKQKGKRNNHTASENRPQRTHDDLMKIWKRLKNALGIDSSIIGTTVLYNEINKVQNAVEISQLRKGDGR
jgi:hypothetical protein